MNDRRTSGSISAVSVPQGETRSGWIPWHPKHGVDWIATYYGDAPPNKLLGGWKWKRATVTVQDP